MSKRDIGTLAALIAATGLAGGALGAWFVPAHQAEAQASVLSGSQITLTDASGKARLTISMTPENQPSLTLADQNGVTRASLSLARDGSASMQAYDPSGAPSSAVLP